MNNKVEQANIFWMDSSRTLDDPVVDISDGAS